MKKILLFAMAGMLFTACGTSTRVVSSWHAPEPYTATIDKILVMAMMTDREAKDYIENRMVADFSAQGIRAVTGTAEFGPQGFGEMTQEQVAQKLQADGFSAIMIVCLTAKDKELNYVPGTLYICPRGSFYGFYGRYRYMWDAMYTPGYYTTSTTYVLDAHLYSLPDDKLIYSAQTHSYDPSGNKALASSFSEKIIENLKNKHVI
ncbi:MAG: hypothetical protein LUD68_08645 [Rikenellaceae bacterium]|nr:hypothetical protein [Rikenellaceae bacterium]